MQSRKNGLMGKFEADKLMLFCRCEGRAWPVLAKNVNDNACILGERGALAPAGLKPTGCEGAGL